MIIKVLALYFISVTLALSCPMIVSAQQPKVIKFNCEPANARGNADPNTDFIILDDHNILANVLRDPPMSYLFTDEALFSINHKFKTYSVHSYDELEAKLSEKAKSLEGNSIRRDMAVRLTEESDSILGFRVSKIVLRGKPGAELWVASDLVPMKVRVVGERIRSSLTEDFWRKAGGNVGMVEIIMLYGVPLKLAIKPHAVCRAEIHESTDLKSSFKVPEGYKRVKSE